MRAVLLEREELAQAQMFIVREMLIYSETVGSRVAEGEFDVGKSQVKWRTSVRDSQIQQHSH